jgi:hypothetical protein
VAAVSEIQSIHYPGIAKACFEIAIDNGGINRDRSEADQRKAFEAWLPTQPAEWLGPIETWLSSLSVDNILLVASGGEDEPETLAAREGAPPFTDDLLNAYFDEVC